MKLIKAIEEKGYFWLDDNQEDKIQGTLKIDTSGESVLELFGEISSSNISLINSDDKDYYHINGIVDNKTVTLKDCFTRKFKMLLPSRFYEILVSVNIAILGVGYSSNEEILFNKVDFSFRDTDEWFNITGIRDSFTRTENASIYSYEMQYIPQSSIIYELLDTYKLEIGINVSIKEFSNIHQSLVEENISLKIYSNENKILDEFIDQIFKIGQFLSFITGQSINLNSVKGYTNILNSDGKTINVGCEIYYNSIFNSSEDNINKDKPLLTFKEINNINSNFFQDWMEAYENLSPALALYFAYQSGAYRFLDSKFLALAQGLETLHRRTNSELSMCEDQYDKMYAEIIDSCPIEHKKWLEAKLQFANELNLRKRLKYLFEPYKSMFGTNRDIKNIIGRIITTRNYLTHYNSDLSQQTATGAELFRLVRYMEAIFIMHFLNIIGIDEENINKISKTSPILIRNFTYVKRN